MSKLKGGDGNKQGLDVVYLRHDEIVYIQCKEDSPIYVMHEELHIWALHKLPLPVPECFSFIPAGCLGFCRPDRVFSRSTSEISGDNKRKA